MYKKEILEYLDELDKQELMVVQVAAILGASFRLDHLLELTSIKASKLLELLRKMAREKLIKGKSGIDEDAYFFVNKKNFFIHAFTSD